MRYVAYLIGLQLKAASIFNYNMAHAALSVYLHISICGVVFSAETQVKYKEKYFLCLGFMRFWSSGV